jgi:hypothetical protein
MRPTPTWLERLQWLVARFPEYAAGPDLGALCAADAWGLYLFLRRMAEGV